MMQIDLEHPRKLADGELAKHRSSELETIGAHFTGLLAASKQP